MRYFRNEATQEVFGFEETIDHQLPYMQEKIDAGYTEITGSWPPLHVPFVRVPPTAQELQDQLSIIQNQLNNLINP
jgi:hypothetical protein